MCVHTYHALPVRLSRSAHLFRAQGLHVVVLGAVEEGAQGPVDRISHHGEELAMSAFVDQRVSIGQQVMAGTRKRKKAWLDVTNEGG